MEEIAKQITINISHAVEILAAIIIGMAVIKAMYNYLLLLKPAAAKITKEEIIKNKLIPGVTEMQGTGIDRNLQAAYDELTATNLPKIN